MSTSCRNVQRRIPGVVWPPIAHEGSEARVLSQLKYLEQTERWTSAQLASHQFQQLDRLVRHAVDTTAFYARRFRDAGIDPDVPLDEGRWERVPILTRRDLQTDADGIFSHDLSMRHGATHQLTTSGSTGEPVSVLGTGVTRYFWRVSTLRDHLWHGRDLSGTLATIRNTPGQDAGPPAGHTFASWGAATSAVSTGPCVLLDINTSVEQQVAWLRSVDPTYLLTYPSVARAIASVFGAEGNVPPQLKEVRTFAESVDADLRAHVRRAMGVPLTDTYSSQEVGCMALQCPSHDHYHVQAETVRLEVLDDRDRPCAPGQIGRVVVSSLHNFASPLIRYEIGDYAEVGTPCSCGRQLPTLKRILGRERNLLVLPNGERRWPAFGQSDHPHDLPPFFQFQIVQRSLEEIELNVVRDSLAGSEEKEQARRYLQKMLGYPFKVTINEVDSIPRSKSGKFEDFRSDVGLALDS